MVNINELVSSIGNKGVQLVKQNPLITGIGIGALTGAAAVVGAGVIARDSNTTTRRKRSSNSYKRKRSSRTSNRKRKRYTPHTAGKRKDTSRKRIRQTKNGQPYIILANGRARFIKKKNASSSRKRKGGKY